MTLIEPCCTQKHWPEIRRKAGMGGTVPFHGYGDLSIAELFPVLLTRYIDTELTIVAPSLPDVAAEAIRRELNKKRARMDGKGNIDVIRHLTLITDLRQKKSPEAAKWLKKNPWPDRLTLCNIQQNDTAILLPDIAIYGGINLVYGGHFTALASTSQGFINSLQQTYTELVKRQ